MSEVVLDLCHQKVPRIQTGKFMFYKAIKKVKKMSLFHFRLAYRVRAQETVLLGQWLV